MTSGVVVAENVGFFCTRDIRSLPQDISSVEVLVLAARGVPFIGRVSIGEIPGGRGIHRGLVCAACAVARYKLFASELGQLACSDCSRRSSRRHSEKSRHDWKHQGGAEEDFLLRALRPGRRSSDVPADVLAVAASLIVGDHARWSELRHRVDAAVVVAISDEVSVEDVLEAET
jgi:hypothetical protein